MLIPNIYNFTEVQQDTKAQMGTAASKINLLQQETKALRGIIQELQKERAADREKAQELQKELRDQRKMLRRLDGFAKSTSETITKLDGEMDRVWKKIF